MDENKQFYDIYGYPFNPIEFNNWMLYQQPYFNLQSYDVFSGNVGMNYGNVTLQNSFDQYSPNLPHCHFDNNMNNNTTYVNKSKNPRVDRNNNINEGSKKMEISPRFTTDNINVQKNNQNKVVKNEKSLTASLTSKPFEILNRNKKVDDEKFRKSFVSVPEIDLDKDFPPISGTLPTEHSIEHDKMLDYKLALQKPKSNPIVIVNNDNKSLSNDHAFNEEKTKKKRKRHRKKKIKNEPFAFVDEEFPCLDNLKSDEKLQNVQEIIPISEEIKVTKSLPITEKKRSKKRQLMLILPSEMQGQVTVIQKPLNQKSKTKRNTNQGRMKRPIGTLNPLDLTAPVKRGKERLKPKIKKPSKLKKTILHYRNLKKEIREKLNNDSANKGDSENSCVIPPVVVTTKKRENLVNRIHSKNFREYCNHMIDTKINSIISQLLKTLIGFQDKLYNRDPFKAKQKRRLCFGLREVTKFLNMKKLRLIIIAPDLEKIDVEGGLDDIVGLIIKAAREYGIPYVFGLSRSSLAYLCFKKFRVGAIGIFNYDGAENHVKDLLTSVDQAREQYDQIKLIMESISQDESTYSQSVNISVTSCIDGKCDLPCALINNVPYNAGHSRTPSNALSEPISDIGEMNKLLFNSISEDQIKNIDNNSKNEAHLLNEEGDGYNEDKLIGEYVDNILHSISLLNLDNKLV